MLVAAFGLAGIGNLMAAEGSYARAWHLFFFGPLLLLVAGALRRCCPLAGERCRATVTEASSAQASRR